MIIKTKQTFRYVINMASNTYLSPPEPNAHLPKGIETVQINSIGVLQNHKIHSKTMQLFS